ncbi:DUF4910 domain-containing protein [Campylobacter mucosalis]|uniref:DUF4910 domain-containing protein n=1 Tax=Campylobacter mucosalis TaxID=202 RepID=UPI00147058D8|nr:DUF4910 domain-containing protein [Campylobacter mucosalis]
MFSLAKSLFKIHRSITGKGFNTSLDIVLNHAMGGGSACFLKPQTYKNAKNFRFYEIKLEISNVKSGTKIYDWVVPNEWEIDDAFIITPSGKKICDFKRLNLHVLGYSEAVDKFLSLDELKTHLYTLPDLPNAVPYATSYYERRWGFCIAKNELDTLETGTYHAVIKSSFKKDGHLRYARIFIPATQKTDETILISTYLCHPQMANNELSGPVVWANLVRFVRGLNTRRYNYEFVITPETIGSICYIHENFSRLKQNVKGGFVLTCIGDEREYSLVLSPNEQRLSDKIALHTIKHRTNKPKIYSFKERGSDERQYNTPALDLGVVALSRSKFGEYKEYHTSLDDFSVVTKNGLNGGFLYARNCILNLETNAKFVLNTICEPNLGKRGLIRTLSLGKNHEAQMILRNFLAFCDGKNDTLKIAEILGVELYKLRPIIEVLLKNNLIKEIK